MKSLMRMIKLILPGHRMTITIAILCALGISATPYAFSFLGRWLVDDVLGVGRVGGLPRGQAETAALLLRFFIISVGFHLVGTLLAAMSEFFNARAVHRMTYSLRSSVNERLAFADMTSYGKETPGGLMTRIMDDTGAIPGNVTHLIINFVTQIAMLVLGAVLLIRLNAKLALYVALALPFYAVVCALFIPKIRANTLEIRVRWTQLMGYAIERISNIITVKNYAQEGAETESFNDRVNVSLGLNRRQHRFNLLFGSLSGLVTAFATLAVLAVGFLRLREGEMQLGEVLAFYQVTAQLFVPVSALVGMTVVSQTLRVYADRVYEILDAQSQLDTSGDETPANGDIEFDRVSLRYAEGGPFAVHELSLTIPASSTVALVGPTGCGKSTVLSLLTRLIDPSDGTIQIGGVDIKRRSITEHRRSVGNVLFESTVFAGTLAENIAFGSKGTVEADVIEACRAVDLSEFIASHPKGVHTQIGTGGEQLDPETELKINVARALVTRPHIVTVDDTYAQVDEDVERRIREGIRRALPESTFIIATSRLSIAQSCDAIFVLQKGSIVEHGNHESLMSSAGLYRRMYGRQMGVDISGEA